MQTSLKRSRSTVITTQRFQDYNQLHFNEERLLQQALTHRSYVNEHDDPEAEDNERLEFLGDAVVDFVAGEMLFYRFPDVDEGELTRLRSALVRTESLAQLAVDCRVGETLRMGKGEEQGGGRTRLNNLCGAFEALIGALYIDQGLDAVRAFLNPRFESRLAQVIQEQLDKDARSLLQERSQAEYSQTPQYRTVSMSGPDHEREFTVEVLIGERVVGTGTGRSKQAASQSAAQDALRRLEQEA